MPEPERTIRRCRSRHAARRVMSMLLLVLFGSQATGLAWSGCDRSVDRSVASAMPGMNHDGGGATSNDMPDRPAPTPGSGCDHTLPVGACSVGAGCLIAVPCVTVVASVQRAFVAEEFLPPAGRPLALKSAPDTPPPKV